MKKFMITGSGRSGTTMMVGLLGAHPEIFCTNELGTFDNESTNLKSRFQLLRKRIQGVAGGLGFIRNPNKFDPDKFEKETSSMKMPPKTDELIQALISSCPIKVNLYGDKFPDYIMNSDEWFADKKNVKILFMIRDPRDVIGSYISNHGKVQTYTGQPQWWTSPNFQTVLTKKNWLDYMYSWNRFKTKSGFQYCELYFEDLLIHPEKTAKKVADFLEVDPMKLVRIFSNPKLVDKSYFQKWRKTVPEINKELPEEWIKMMEQYGYQV